MKKSQFFMLLISAMMAFAALAFTSCVDDNEDNELPYLEVTPASLSFNAEGTAADGSEIAIKTNRPWRVTFEKDVTWVRLSATEGKGSATLSVSVPASNDARETKLTIATYNSYGNLLTQVVKITQGTVKPVEMLYKETFGTTGGDKAPYPTVAEYTGWDKSGIGSSAVTYSGENAQLRNSSPSDNNFSGYEGSGGTNLYFAAAPNDFIVKDITVPQGTTAFTLTFGAYIYNPASADPYYSTYSVALSADGVTWSNAVPFEMTFVAEKSWNLATSKFQVKEYTSKLYIKFSAVSGNNRIDDVILNTGTGGVVVDLNGGGVDPDPEAKVITIPELNAMMTTTKTAIDANNDRYFDAVVMNDVTGGNYSFNNLILATEGSTAAGNGVTLYGSQVEPTVIKVDKGDKVRVTLYKGLAQAVNYNGMFEVTGDAAATWCKVEKTGAATVSTVTITADKLAAYQGMAVMIQSATTAAAGIWANADNISSHTFSAGGTDFTVFCKKGAAAFLDQPYKVATGNISGLAAVNSNKGQLVPRNLADVAAFSSTDPSITAVDPASLTFPAQGGTQTIAVTVANQGANALSVSGLSGILSATVSGTTVTVKANPNTGAAVEQTLTISLQNGNSKTVPVKVAAAGSGSDTQIVVDFASGVTANPELPTSKQGTPPPATVHSIGGYDFTFSATEAYYLMNGNKLLIGKQDSYIGLPIVPGKKLVKVEFTTPVGSSGKTTVGVTDADGNFVAGGESQTLAASQTFTYELTGTDAAVVVSYRLTVTNANNFQIEKLTLTYGDGGGPAPTTPEITAVNPASLTWAATATDAKTVAVNGNNLSGVTLTATSSASNSAFTFAVNGTTVTVTPKAANTGSADITETLTIAAPGGNSKTVALTQSKPSGGGTESFESISQFVFPYADNSTPNAYYCLTDKDGNNSTANGQVATGIKLGTAKLAGVYTSSALGLTGNKTLTFYAVGWTKSTATIYVRVNNGGSVSTSSVTVQANETILGNPPFTLTVTDADKYTFDLTGLTAGSTISLSTDASFTAAGNTSTGRAAIFGIQVK